MFVLIDGALDHIHYYIKVCEGIEAYVMKMINDICFELDIGILLELVRESFRMWLPLSAL